MKKHNEFMKDVEVESSLPAQTCRALSPESQEDISMYAGEKEKPKVLLFCDNPNCFATHIAKKNYPGDAVYTEGETQ